MTTGATLAATSTATTVSSIQDAAWKSMNSPGASRTVSHRHSLQPRQLSLLKQKPHTCQNLGQNQLFPPRRGHRTPSAPTKPEDMEPESQHHSVGASNTTSTSSSNLHRRSSNPNRRRYRQSLRLLDHHIFSDERRPASSRSHLRYYWHRRHGSPSQSQSPIQRASSDGPWPPLENGLTALSLSMTKEEFEALPLTIQRKHFSTFERLRFAHDTAYSLDSRPATESTLDFSSTKPSSSSSPRDDNNRPPFQSRLPSDSMNTAQRHRPKSKSTSDHLWSFAPAAQTFAWQPEGHCRPLTSSRRHQSVILDAADEAFLKVGKRQSKVPRLELALNEPASPKQQIHMMHPLVRNQASMTSEHQIAADPMYDSLRWLEQDDDLDLRLCFDEEQFGLRADVAARKKGRFRRHLSISKLNFGRGAGSTSRPGTKDASSPSTLSASSMASLSNPPPGHVRRRSRALSLMSPNKVPTPDAPNSTDAAASHYQDPEARMKLRVYLASAHKFDEAVEFGFPSIDEVQTKDDSIHKRLGSRPEPLTGLAKLHTSMDDEKASMCSDAASTNEPDSPRTPVSMEKPSLMRPTRASKDSNTASRIDYAQAPVSSREMTLRMTLTRPDLRADEQDIYGWQRAKTGRRSHGRDEPLSPRAYTSRERNSKDSIERQLAALDQENFDDESGMVKRFWNRVRR